MLYRLVSQDTYREKKKYLEEVRMIKTIKSKSHILYKSIDNIFKEYSSSDICIVSTDIILTSIITEKLVEYIIKKDTQDIGRQLTISILKSNQELASALNMKKTFGMVIVVDTDITNLSAILTKENYQGSVFVIVDNYDYFSQYKDLPITGCIMKNVEVIIKVINKLITYCVMRSPLSDSDENSLES